MNSDGLETEDLYQQHVLEDGEFYTRRTVRVFNDEVSYDVLVEETPDGVYMGYERTGLNSMADLDPRFYSPDTQEIESLESFVEEFSADINTILKGKAARASV